jgi:transcriptional regulator with XRE-family HTH domain
MQSNRELLTTRIRAACEKKARQENRYSPKGQLKPYTSYRLGKDAGIDTAYAYKVLHGQSLPSSEMLTKICNALECSPQERADIFHAAGYLSPEELEEESAA